MRPFLLATTLLAGCGAAATPPPRSATPEPSERAATAPPTTATAPAAGTVSPGPARVTEPFRREHAELREHLAHVDALVASLATTAPDGRRAIEDQVVRFYSEHIVPHAAWEESALYPAVDRRASRGEPFTASMRFEHTVVHRWIEELRRLAADPDPARFVHQADRLFGLVTAHFEAEEEVLLPVLDRTMTPAEYERELGTAHHQETR